MVKNVPFLKIVIPAIAGIVVANMFDFPAVWVFACFAVVMCAAIWLRRSNMAGVYLGVGIGLLYMFFATLARPSSVLPHGERIAATARIIDGAQRQGRWDKYTARVRSYKVDSTWNNAGEKIFLYADTACTFDIGDEVALKGYFNAAGTGGYGSLMERRGYTARCYLTEGNLIYHIPNDRFSLRQWFAGVQAGAGARLARLGLEPAEEPIAQAMLLGVQSEISRERRQEYSRAGTAHILSVSGLHVGIVFLFINMLLWFVPAFRGGHLAKNFIAVTAIWFYAALCGLSPPVVRSAFLFTGVQLALALSARASSLNTLLATAAIMLAISPNSLWDISFQLSFTAVLFILLWGVPLYRRMRTRRRALNAVIGAVNIAVVATVATAPLVAYHFGYFSVVGVIVNPLIGMLSYVIIIGGLIWLLAPAAFMAPILKWAVGGAIEIQNRASAWGSAFDRAVIEVEPSATQTIAIYLGYIVLTLIFGILLPEQKQKKELSLNLK